jgi:hypothetical protein
MNYKILDIKDKKFQDKPESAKVPKRQCKEKTISKIEKNL